ncbi:DUF6754 domain-containing protein [Planctomycetota bacterium]
MTERILRLLPAWVIALGLGLAATPALAQEEPAPEGPGPEAQAQALPQPDQIWVEDTPNDNGRRITVRWSPASDEQAAVVSPAVKKREYEIQLAPRKEGPYRKVSQVFAHLAWATELTEDYGVWAGRLEGHGIIANPLTLFDPGDFAIVILSQKTLAALKQEAEAKPTEAEEISAVIGRITKHILKAPVLGKLVKSVPELQSQLERLQALSARTEKREGETAPSGQDLDEAQQIAKTFVAMGTPWVEEMRKGLTEQLGAESLKAAEEIYEDESIDDLSEYTGRVQANANRRIERVIAFRTWYARTVTHAPGNPSVISAAIGEGRPVENRFNWLRLNNLVLMILLGGTVLFFVHKARRNPDMYLRRIGGLDAVDEALGRSTEMGKPVLFVHGLKEMKEVSTIAAINILGEIAKHVAKFDTKLLCANVDPIVLSVSQETVRESYTHAGRPDAYQEDDVFLAASEQFAYVAAVDGIMVRQQPAANFYCGYFYAESLILAETGATTGAIQIAATDAFTQLPFFVTTCDYTLMGEELYAASAYLSRDPLLLGSLKGQDIAKAVMLVMLVVGTILISFNVTWVADLVKSY